MDYCQLGYRSYLQDKSQFEIKPVNDMYKSIWGNVTVMNLFIKETLFFVVKVHLTPTPLKGISEYEEVGNG